MILAKLNELRTREKILLVVGLVVVLGLVVDQFVVKAVMRYLDELDRDIRIVQEDLLYNLRVLNSREQVEPEYRNVRGLLVDRAPDAEQIDRMKGEIDEIARRTGLVIVSMEHRQPRVEPYCKEYVLDIGSFEGSMPAVLSFLDAVRNASGLTRVEDLNLAPARELDEVNGSMTVTKVARLDAS